MANEQANAASIVNCAVPGSDRVNVIGTNKATVAVSLLGASKAGLDPGGGVADRREQSFGGPEEQFHISLFIITFIPCQQQC